MKGNKFNRISIHPQVQSRCYLLPGFIRALAVHRPKGNELLGANTQLCCAHYLYCFSKLCPSVSTMLISWHLYVQEKYERNQIHRVDCVLHKLKLHVGCGFAYIFGTRVVRHSKSQVQSHVVQTGILVQHPEKRLRLVFSFWQSCFISRASCIFRPPDPKRDNPQKQQIKVSALLKKYRFFNFFTCQMVKHDSCWIMCVFFCENLTIWSFICYVWVFYGFHLSFPKKSSSFKQSNDKNKASPQTAVTVIDVVFNSRELEL